MSSFLRSRNTLAVLAALAALAGLAETGRAFLNHEMDSLALLVSAQACFLALILVPPVLAEVRDRQTLSIYRSMYIGK
jgi:hypothetical protein